MYAAFSNVCVCVSHQEVNSKSRLVFWRSLWSSTLLSQRLWALTSSAHRSAHWSLFISLCVYSSAPLFMNKIPTENHYNGIPLKLLRIDQSWCEGSIVKDTSKLSSVFSNWCHRVFSHSAITGEAEDGREGETLPDLCQTVVEGVPRDTSVTPIQNGEDLCTGSSKLACQAIDKT